jgi:hypothetical protein
MDYYSLSFGVALMVFALKDSGEVRDGIRLMGIWYVVPFISTLAFAFLMIFNGFSAYFGRL